MDSAFPHKRPESGSPRAYSAEHWIVYIKAVNEISFTMLSCTVIFISRLIWEAHQQYIMTHVMHPVANRHVPSFIESTIAPFLWPSCILLCIKGSLLVLKLTILSIVTIPIYYIKQFWLCLLCFRQIQIKTRLYGTRTHARDRGCTTAWVS